MFGAGSECRHPGARRGIGGLRGCWEALRGVGVLGAIRGHQGV